ncbi:type II toxin-antitoxin system RelE/ParE family toxin [Candidatus Altiarchaeota archaeon]
MKRSYTIIYDTKASQDLCKLPQNIGKRIFNKIKESKKDVKHFWTRLEGRTDYRIRIGHYRAIADIDNTEKTINITKIGHRSTIYEKI